ncbi:MAG: hypothetical protein CMP63_05825 [Flavobacteriales bacterium]|nr:hypothetical protein [Flavobacteriales bacterium]|tara:strand:+ start:1313 stop:1744 length:432 start_codon:yes stop_codon:yes gene_type:complete
MEKFFQNKIKISLSVILFVFLFAIISCEKEDSDFQVNNLSGNWLANENSSILGQRIYETTIVTDSLDISTIKIYNFYKIGKEEIVFAAISDTRKNITISEQTLKGNSIEGNGKILDDEINLNYFINDGNQIDTVKANYTRDDI